MLNQRFTLKISHYVCTRAGGNLGVLAAKINVLRQKLVIICATHAGANLGVLTAKIRVLGLKLFVPLVREQI